MRYVPIPDFHGKEPMSRQNSYRVVLADDHELFRQALREMLQGMSGIEVVGEAGNGIELIKLIGRASPHMAILDISMPKLRGIEVAAELEKRHPDLKVLILTIHKDEAYRRRAISVGAEGYLVKDAVDEELFPAITMIKQGHSYFPPLS